MKLERFNNFFYGDISTLRSELGFCFSNFSKMSLAESDDEFIKILKIIFFYTGNIDRFLIKCNSVCQAVERVYLQICEVSMKNMFLSLQDFVDKYEYEGKYIKILNKYFPNVLSKYIIFPYAVGLDIDVYSKIVKIKDYRGKIYHKRVLDYGQDLKNKLKII